MRHELAHAIGKTIARWRSNHGLTQEQLALALDIDPVTVSRFERGVTLPSLPTIHKMAGVFGIPMARFFEEVPQQGKISQADNLAAMMGNLTAAEQSYLVDTIKRFCLLMSKRKAGKETED